MPYEMKFVHKGEFGYLPENRIVNDVSKEVCADALLEEPYFLCTRPLNHDGKHAAHSFDRTNPDSISIYQIATW